MTKPTRYRYISRDELDLTKYKVTDKKVFSIMIQDFLKPHYQKSRGMNYYLVHHNYLCYRILEDELY